MKKLNKVNKAYFVLAILPALILFSLPGARAQASSSFNPELIISDDEFLDNSSMNLNDIQAFLQAHNSYLARYISPNASGIRKTAANIIYDAAVNNYDCDGVGAGGSLTQAQKEKQCVKVTINPKVLLVLLQKEQSLIEDPSPSTRQLDWAAGYGCPDGQACNTHWQGFGKQVNSAALQFFDYMQNPGHYTYRAGNTYTITNTNRPSMRVTPLNQATAALYNYTPHVYNGNYNFHKLWLRYFTFNYPNNTLLQARGEPGVWVIKNGIKRPFLTKGALTSRYDINKIIQVNKSELNRYPTGEPIKFPQYSLVRSPRGTVFLLIDDKRRGFASREALRVIGINPEEIVDASWDDINAYEEAAPITATSSYPTGALLQDSSTGGVFWVADATKAPLWDAVLLKTKYRGKSITPVPPEKLASYKTVEPAIFGDGELITTDTSPAVYVIDNKKRRPLVSAEIFEKLGYKWKNIISVPKKILDLYEEGEPIAQIYSDEEPLDLGTASSTPDMIATGTPEIASSSEPAIASNTPDSTALQEEINSVLNP